MRAETIRHNLRCSTIDGLFYMFMVGFAETFFPLFVLTMFGSEVGSGLVATVPLMLATILQLFAPQMVQRVRSYKRAVVACAVLQTVVCPLLAVVALIGSAPMWLIFALAAAYHAGAIVGGAPWTAMMGVLVPGPMRAAFFAKRSRVLQLGAVVAIVAGAALLDSAPRIGPALAESLTWWPWMSNAWQTRPTLVCFAILFTLAGAVRAVSAWYLHKHIEPPNVTAGHRSLSVREAFARLRHDGRWRLVGVLALFSFAMMIGSPFWAAYVKQVCGLSFLEWAGLIVIWYLGKAIAVSWAGELAQRRGRRRLLVYAGIMMTPVPALWALSTDPIYLAIAQMIAGMTIATWELGVMLATLEAFDEDERTSLLSVHTLSQWCAGTGGSFVGGAALERMGGTHGAFAAIFIASALARGLVTLVLARTHRSGLPVARK
ncbi:MAG TPA: MFS transporter [Phycisphaerales bacterium]|nr:MFS transporter [Phycisphaerales bacterium]